MDSQPANTVHAIVTDPPYGLREYTSDEKRKLREGRAQFQHLAPGFEPEAVTGVPGQGECDDEELEGGVDRPSDRAGSPVWL